MANIKLHFRHHGLWNSSLACYTIANTILYFFRKKKEFISTFTHSVHSLLKYTNAFLFLFLLFFLHRWTTTFFSSKEPTTKVEKTLLYVRWRALFEERARKLYGSLRISLITYVHRFQTNSLISIRRKNILSIILLRELFLVVKVFGSVDHHMVINSRPKICLLCLLPPKSDSRLIHKNQKKKKETRIFLRNETQFALIPSQLRDPRLIDPCTRDEYYRW